jgi:N utilization substance protein A
MIKDNVKTHLELQARPELLEIIDSLSKDKSVSNEEVFEAMEFAIKKVANATYGNLYDIRVKINRSNGAIVVQKVINVVEDVENNYHQVSLADAKKIDSNVVLGDELVDILPTPDFSRNNFQPFRQMLLSKIKEAEKDREYESYKDKKGEIVSGVVKRIESNNIFLELNNKAEAFLRKDMCLPRERLEIGERVRALIVDVKKDYKSPQIVLSRTDENFIAKLFSQEIFEIYEGVVQIKAIAREPGSRSKVAVISKDPSIDPISICIGFKGARIQGVLAELKGEKIDLVQYSDNLANFVINAFYPTDVLKVIVDEERSVVEVVLKAEALNLAIGRRGQNINLVSKLVNCHIDIMSEEEEKEKRQNDMQQKIAFFTDSLDVDEVIAQLLAIEGFSTLEDILYNDGESLKAIPAFNEEIIAELQSRAVEYKKTKQKELLDELKNLSVKQDLITFINEKADDKMLLLLAKADVKSLEDFADLSIFELLEILPKALIDKKTAENLILLAREQVYKK